MLILTDAALERLRDKHVVLAEVIDSDRAIDAMRQTNVIDFALVLARRERVQAAARCYGYQLRGNGDMHA